MEERVLELESIVKSMHASGDSEVAERQKGHAIRETQFLMSFEQGQTCQLTTGRGLVNFTKNLHMGCEALEVQSPVYVVALKAVKK